MYTDTQFFSATIDNKHVQLVLWNAPSDSEYIHLRPLFYRDCEVVAICFSIDSPESFLNVKRVVSFLEFYTPSDR
jgi:GTPase SAR1 family protein